jgi:putative redox protein
MHAEIQWLDKVHFVATTGSGHRILLDGPADSGGENRGARPMELLLAGLGGCTSYDVVTILDKSRQQVTQCVTEITAKRAESVPAVFEQIHIHFKIGGTGLDAKKVARAVELSAEKYCSAAIMLVRGGVNITHDFDIVQIDDPAEGSPS